MILRMVLILSSATDSVGNCIIEPEVYDHRPHRRNRRESARGASQRHNRFWRSLAGLSCVLEAEKL